MGTCASSWVVEKANISGMNATQWPFSPNIYLIKELDKFTGFFVSISLAIVS